MADMLTRIRNAGRAKHKSVDIPGSQMKTALAGVLKEEGFIRNFKFIKGPLFANIVLADEINRKAEQINKKQKVLLEIKTSGETAKLGLDNEKEIFEVAE
ncbi:MAG: 30S ribosomal protein S8, partial [Desulfobacteraceae bacterium]|nr:30S ribosomal protein S8 [Desulfobacteraceae bacterium]